MSLFTISSKFLVYLPQTNSVEPDQTPRCVASDLVLRCLMMSHKIDAMLKWVNNEKLTEAILIYWDGLVSG